MPNRNDRFRSGNRNDYRNPGHGNRGSQRSNYQNQNQNRNRTRAVYFENSNDIRRGPLRGRGKNFRRGNISDARDDPENQWFKVTIPHGDKSTKDFLLTSLHSMCERPFVPYNYQVDGNTVIFFVQGLDTSDALKSCSRRITNTNGFKYTIIVSKSTIPQTSLDAQTLVHLKEAMSRRYDGNRRYLNMSKFVRDEYLKEQGLYIPLSRQHMLIAVIRIIKENIPDLVILNLSDNRLSNLEPLNKLIGNCKLLKSLDLSFNQIRQMSELDNLKGLELEEIVLQKNPASDMFKDRAAYISFIRGIFPKVVKLDDDELSAPIGFDVGESTSLPDSLGSCIPPNTNDFVIGFIQQYFSIYDSDDRQSLADAYHEQALFSFAINSAQPNRNQSFFPSHMFQDSRNLMKVRDPTARTRMLQQGKSNIVSTLMSFPKTKHELDSFLVDTYVFPNQQLINVVINGVYRETTKKFGVQTRAFCRSFLIVPNLIINDLLNLSNATVEQIQKYGKSGSGDNASNRMEDQTVSSVSLTMTTAGTPNSLYMNNANLVKRFAEVTGMNTGFSLQCLEEHAYDFDAAIQVFQTLHSQGMIPSEAFQS